LCPVMPPLCPRCAPIEPNTTPRGKVCSPGAGVLVAIPGPHRVRVVRVVHVVVR